MIVPPLIAPNGAGEEHMTSGWRVFNQPQQPCDIYLNNKMKLCLLLLLGTLCLISNGMPPISSDYNTHCRCLQLESRIIPPDSLRSIKLYSEGPHCPDTEVIAGLVNGAKVCLNPRSSWVRKLVQFVLQKQYQHGGALPKNKS